MMMMAEEKKEAGVPDLSLAEPRHPMRVSQALSQYALLGNEAKNSFQWPTLLHHMLHRFRSFSDAIALTETSLKLQQYELVQRVGQANSDNWLRHDGSSAAVFEGRVGEGLQAMRVAVRLIINSEQQDQTTTSMEGRLSKETVLLYHDGAFGVHGCPHPNVLPILDHFVDMLPPQLPHFDVDRCLLAPRAAFSVTPLCHMSLHQLLHARLNQRRAWAKKGVISENGVLSELVVIHLALGIAAGLNHLHQHYVVHRDVTPDNILLYWSPDLDPDTLRQVESGEVGNVDDEMLLRCVPMVANLGQSIQLTPRGSFVVDDNDVDSLGGAVGYLPPEIRDARPNVDQLDYTKSDVYGLGCVMYKMMHHQPRLPILSDTGLSERDLPRGYLKALRELVVQCTAAPAERCSIPQALQKLVALENLQAAQHKFTDEKVEILDCSSTGRVVRQLAACMYPTHCCGVALTKGRLILSYKKRGVVHLMSADHGRSRKVTQWGDSKQRRRAEEGQPARFKSPWGVALDEQRGVVYVADNEAHCVVVVHRSTGHVKAVWGSGGPDLQQFHGPCSLTYCSKTDQLYVVDRGNNCVKVLRASDGHCVQAIAADMKSPEGVAVDADRIYITDTEHHRVSVFDKTTLRLRFHFAQGHSCCAVCVNAEKGLVYVADAWGCRICVYRTNGRYVHNFPTVTAGDSPVQPANLLLDAAAGLLYVTNWKSTNVGVYTC